MKSASCQTSSMGEVASSPANALSRSHACATCTATSPTFQTPTAGAVGRLIERMRAVNRGTTASSAARAS